MNKKHVRQLAEEVTGQAIFKQVNQPRSDSRRPHPNALRLMDNPPTATLTKSTTSGITNAQIFRTITYPSTDLNPPFSYSGEVVRADWQNPTTGYDNVYPGRTGVKAVDISTNANYAGYMDVEFAFDGTLLELEVSGAGQGLLYRVLVDEGRGEQLAFETAPGAIPLDGGFYQLLLTFPNRTLRRIRLLMYGTFYGVKTGPNDTLFTSGRRKGPRAVFLGDSFTEGSGADGWYNGYAPTLAALMGWEAIVCGSGGTGFVNPSSGLNRLKYADRLLRDVIKRKPDIVIVQGGQNDTTYPADEVFAQADHVLRTLRDSLPKTKIYVVGNFAPSSTITPAILATKEAIKTAALKYSLPIVDSIDGVAYGFDRQPTGPAQGGWLTGSGNISSQQATGNRSLYIAADGGHPSPAGHKYIAERLAFEIARIGL